MRCSRPEGLRRQGARQNEIGVDPVVVPSVWQTKPAPNRVQSASTWQEARQRPPSSSAQIEPDGQSPLVVQAIVHIPAGK
jgi:hypothetical protein